MLQVQAELGEGHLNLITAKEVLLTRSHLALSLELAAGGSMTSYVGDKLQNAGPTELVLSEDEARYFMRVRGVGTSCEDCAVEIACTGCLGRQGPPCSTKQTGVALPEGDVYQQTAHRQRGMSKRV